MSLRIVLVGVGCAFSVAAVAGAGCVAATTAQQGPPDSGEPDTSMNNPDTSNVPDTSPPVDSGCGDTQSNAMNCGSCGHQCTATYACIKGVCGNTVTQISSSPTSAHTCALLLDGTVWCWGYNAHGQLGLGGTNKTDTNKANQVPKDSSGATFDHVTQIASGDQQVCALKDDGTVWCWGDAALGETGQTPGAADMTAPTQVPALTGYKKLAAGGGMTCGIDGSGSVACIGVNDHARLGHPAGMNGDVACGSWSCGAFCNKTPVAIAGISGASELFMTSEFACAVDGSGAVRCWGNDNAGQLGDMGTACAVAQKTVSGVLPSPVAIGGNAGNACALFGTSANAQCWGENGYKEESTATGPLGATAYGGGVLGLEAAGGGYHLCVLLTSGKVVCTGLGDHFAIGNSSASTTMPNTTPLNVLVAGSPIDNVTHIVGGYLQGCALRNDGTVWCWGDNVVSGSPSYPGRLGCGDNVGHVGACQVAGLP